MTSTAATPLHLSIPESAQYIVDEIGVDPKAPTPNQMGRLFANLVITRSNGMFDNDKWEAFLDHLCYPDDCPCPDCFLQPVATLPSFQACLNVVEEIYQSCPAKEA